VNPEEIAKSLLDGEGDGESAKEYIKRVRVEKFRMPAPEEVEFDYELRAEYDRPEQTHSDPAHLAVIRQRIAQGNPWGWCDIHVTASWRDPATNQRCTGVSEQGWWSFESEEEFVADGYPDLKTEAYNDLLVRIQRVRKGEPEEEEEEDEYYDEEQD
jgi:hypothetical protein